MKASCKGIPAEEVFEILGSSFERHPGRRERLGDEGPRGASEDSGVPPLERSVASGAT